MIKNQNKIIGIIPAAGIGERFGSKTPKQYFRLDSNTIIEKTIDIFINHQNIDTVYVAVSEKDHLINDQSFCKHPKIKLVIGGSSRGESVLNCVKKAAKDGALFSIVHDAVRPNITSNDIDQLIQHKDDYDLVFFYRPITDSIKIKDSIKDKTVKKDDYYIVQTPQIAKTKTLRDVLLSCVNNNIDIPDESFAMEMHDKDIHKILGRTSNIKITHKDDLDLISKKTKYGIGYDIHSYRDGSGFKLGGHFIKCDFSIVAHSDGDVLIHSISDAILGALGIGDIGIFFNDSDPENKDMDSASIFKFCIEKLEAMNYEILHIDANIICQQPKINPQRDDILNSLAGLLNLDINQLSIKATTTERLGNIGANKAMAVESIVTIGKL